MSLTIIVDDDELTARTMSDGLARQGIAAEACFSAAAALARLERGDVDTVVLDDQLPDLSGVEACCEIARRWSSVDVLVMSAYATLDRAMAAVQAGAHDFLTKPFSIKGLALRLARIREERARRAKLGLGEPPSFGERHVASELIGKSAAMQRLRVSIDQLARAGASVLLWGESGTGKELVARELHQKSRRVGGPFVAVNCAALPELLLESELFGHVRGAFTDARADRRGLFAEASGGTIFLDEIGELSAALQPKLLRTLEEHTVRPIGGPREIPIDVRVIAATHRNLKADMECGRFRPDLYYRLDVLRVTLPALREREEDIVTLAEHFAARAALREQKPIRGLSPAAAQRLRLHSWPGNVRELRNCIEHTVAMSSGELLDIADLPDELRHLAERAPREDDWPTLDELERRYISRVLSRVDENRSAAARILGIDRRTLMRKLARRA
ncbi:MAG TPA: sigma-54 dependent transcriptional regulator [Kofleriaceae bacterium]|nr:sigma-54 dependent transcriptional regulator [Kofleriaceae bacterium]